jgi:hypothetical protein
MLPIALAGTRPHFRDASTHPTLESRICSHIKEREQLHKIKNFLRANTFELQACLFQQHHLSEMITLMACSV